jgi:WD40 repeat protein
MRVIDTERRKPIDGLAVAPDGSSLVLGMSNHGAVIHDLVSGRPPIRLRGGSTIDPSHLIYSAGRVYSITYQGRIGFDPATGEPGPVGPSDPAVRGYCRGFVESADGSRLVTSHSDGGVRLTGWAARNGGWERTWTASQGPSSGLAISSRGDRVAQIGCLTPDRWDYQLLLRDGATGELVATGGYGYAMLARAQFRPDGRQVIAAREMSLLVWDTLRPRKPVTVRNDSRKHFTAAAYHPSGRYLFTTSNDATVTVWDTDTWTRVKRFDWAIGRLRSVAVSPDGLLAAAGSDRGKVVVWDVDL